MGFWNTLILVVILYFVYKKMDKQLKSGDRMLYPYFHKSSIDDALSNWRRLDRKCTTSWNNFKKIKTPDKSERDNYLKEDIKLHCSRDAWENCYMFMIHTNYNIMSGGNISDVEDKTSFFLADNYRKELEKAFKEQGFEPPSYDLWRPL